VHAQARLDAVVVVDAVVVRLLVVIEALAEGAGEGGEVGLRLDFVREEVADAIGGGEGVVGLEAPDIAFKRALVHEVVVVGEGGPVGVGDEGDEVAGDAAEARGGDDIAGEGLAHVAGGGGRVINDRHAGLAEVALLHKRGGQGGDGEGDGGGAEILGLGEVPEGLVATIVHLGDVDGAADGAAGFVEPLLGAEVGGGVRVGVASPGVSIPDVAAHIVERGAVEPGGAALGDVDLNAATDAAVFGRVVRAEHLEFAEHFRGREVEDGARLDVQGAGAIDKNFLGAAAGAGDGLFAVVGHAGHEVDKGAGVADTAGEEGQVIHHLGRNGVAAFGRGGFEERGLVTDGDRLLHVADFELEVEVNALGDADFDIFAGELLEAALFHHDHVATGGQLGEDIQASLG